MIKPPAFIGAVPVARTIRPPAIKPPLWDVLPGDINPFARCLRFGQMVNLNRRMANDFQKFFVIPDIIFARCNI